MTHGQLGLFALGFVMTAFAFSKAVEREMVQALGFTILGLGMWVGFIGQVIQSDSLLATGLGLVVGAIPIGMVLIVNGVLGNATPEQLRIRV